MLDAAGIAWSLLKKLPWKWIGLAVAVASILIAIDARGYSRGRHSRDDEVGALGKTIDNTREASAQAERDNHAAIALVNGLQDQITKDKENDYPAQLADARSALAAYVLRHPAPASGDAGQGGASGISDPAGQPDDAATQAVVSVADLDACAQSFVTATGLQDWIRKEAAIPR
jgi:hypothetical protein